MTERMGVTYLPVLGEGRHLAFFNERNDGTKTVIESWGQNKDSLTFSQKVGGTLQDWWRGISDNFGSPWGAIVWAVGHRRACLGLRDLPLSFSSTRS
jgi:hypothetical protein